MREIGGYIELEQFDLPMLHEEAIALNCGRNCLAYLIIAKKIRKIALPYFLCDCIYRTCIKYGVSVRFYHINESFLPVNLQLCNEEWLYLVNAYGQLTNIQITRIKEQYQNVILDQTHAYFQLPMEGMDALYTCRKYFGVTDGAFLYTDTILENPFPKDESFSRMSYILGRYERTGAEFYEEHSSNDQLFDSEPIKSMSKLTENLLHAIDYQKVKERRTDNYNYLSKQLGTKNRLRPRDIQGAFAYPLWLENASHIRRRMIDQKIYIPTLWPNVLEDVSTDVLEYDFTSNILPIPCDQRYGIREMERICEVLNSCFD